MRIGLVAATGLVAGLLACNNTMAPITQHTTADLRCAATALTLDTTCTRPPPHPENTTASPGRILRRRGRLACASPARSSAGAEPAAQIAIRSWSATDQAIACPCQVARGGVTRQGITSFVEWMGQAWTLAN